MDTNVWLLSIDNRSEIVSQNIQFRYLYPVEVRNHGIMFGIDSIFFRELKKHYLVERFYTSALSQAVFLDKDSLFSSFRMGKISQNMEFESNPCLN